MNEFLASNEWYWRLARTILQGVLGVVIANIDLIMDWCVLDPSVRGLVVAIGRPLSDISPGKLIFPYEQPPVLRELFHYSRTKSTPRKNR